MTTLKKRKGISPVIATVVLVAVTITIVIGVAYWLGGISSQYTSFEKVEIQSTTCTVVNGNWKIIVTLKNSGTATTTINAIYINDGAVGTGDTEPASVQNDLQSNLPAAGKPLQSGESGTITIWVGGNYLELTSGTTVNIKLHSAAGMDYVKLQTLA